MIQSFGDKDTAKFFNGVRVKRFGPELENAAHRKLDIVNLATKLEQLKVLPNNQLEKLKGDLSGFWSIRINKQYRIVFKWDAGNAYEVSIIDYH